jgi:hypothetical protein
MAREILNSGVNPNDGSGDSLRLASQKINTNFSELYNALGDGSSLLNSDVNFGNKKIFYSNKFESKDELNSISTSTYEGMLVHVHDEGAIYYAHGDSWHKLLSDNSVNPIANYTSPLSSLAYSGSWADVTDKPSIPTNLRDLNIADGLAGQVLVTDGFGNFSFANGPAISYDDIVDKPTLFSGDYDDLTSKPDLSVYQLTADAFDGDYFSLTGRPTIPGDVSDLEDSQNLLAGFSGDYDDLINTPNLSLYQLVSTAFSGNYNDLTNKPTIPTVPTNVSDFVNDAGYLTSETDSQTLSLDGTDLTISNGNTVDLASIVGDSVGNFTFASSVIDTDDSSAITITPSVVTSSSLTVEDDLTVRGNILNDAVGTPELASDTEILLTATNRVEVTQSPFKMASFTTAERDTLTAENGDTIYNTTTNKFQGYANGTWVDLH